MYSGSSDPTIFWVTFTSLVLYPLAGNKGTGIDGLYSPLKIYTICYRNVLIKLIGPKPENERKNGLEIATLRWRVLLPDYLPCPQAAAARQSRQVSIWKLLRTPNLQSVRSFLMAPGGMGVPTSHSLLLGVLLQVILLIFLSRTLSYILISDKQRIIS